ncbi:MAG TPA: ribosome maturation factor RimM [Cyclobacteriaceae bacterium]|nr:ribosome maturation factor RimM [Cyclobacteriaceae bacterium]
MDKENCFQLGYVAKVHGLHGEISIVLDVDYPEDYEDIEHVFVAQGSRLVPLFIEHFVLQPNHKVLAKFEGFDSVEEASKLVGSGLFLPLENLPPLADDQYYFHELIGFTVYDEVHGELGEVKQIYDLQTQDLLGVVYKGKEVLIPIQDEVILKVDKAEKKVFCQLPNGLLEIYLED